jgi:hypothetical protein
LWARWARRLHIFSGLTKPELREGTNRWPPAAAAVSFQFHLALLLFTCTVRTTYCDRSSTTITQTTPLRCIIRHPLKHCQAPNAILQPYRRLCVPVGLSPRMPPYVHRSVGCVTFTAFPTALTEVHVCIIHTDVTRVNAP